jgi:hypothetical protein
VLADECAGGARSIPGIAERLVNALTWTLWYRRGDGQFADTTLDRVAVD